MGPFPTGRPGPEERLTLAGLPAETHYRVKGSGVGQRPGRRELMVELLPQPHGFEGFGIGEVIVLPGRLRVEIAAVERLNRVLGTPPHDRLAETRTGPQPSHQANAQVGQPREAHKQMLIEGLLRHCPPSIPPPRVLSSASDRDSNPRPSGVTGRPGRNRR